MKGKVVCIVCGKDFDADKEGWYNYKSKEGICDECLTGHSKTELLEYATGTR